ncbi:MAG: DUF3566 domain-containing protein [Actinobacteria bacterium]|nr:DUF3566 domain-containing protein [Actinomycetota bacterium]
MDDWLPSERSRTTAKQPTATVPGGVATQDTSDGRRQRFTQAVTSRARAAAARPANTRPTRRLIRRDIMVRRVDPWSVLKISVVFYTCMLIIAMLANAVFWAFVGRLGLIDQVTEIAGALNIALSINTGNILRAFFLVGVLGVIFWSAVNVFLAFLYNLVADLIGGIRIDLAEDE